MAESDGNVTQLATHGMTFEGVLQTMIDGDEASRAFREDCPKGGDLICTGPVPETCSFFQGFRRNRDEKAYVVLCNCSRRAARVFHPNR